MNAHNAATELVKGKRLSSGKCPEHGIVLVKSGAMVENNAPVGTRYKCPSSGCVFVHDARSGSRMEKLLR